MDDIRSIRSELDLTQSEFADQLGVHQSTISRFETGEQPVDKRTLLAAQALLASRRSAEMAFAHVLGVTAEDAAAATGETGEMSGRAEAA